MSYITRNIPAYLQIMSQQIQMAFMYRANLAIDLLALPLKVYLLKVIFAAVYAGRTTVGGIALDQTITFITLANLQTFLLMPVIGIYIFERMREGKIALDLARPAPFLGQLIAHQFGGTLAMLPFVIIAVPFAAFLGGLQMPPSATAALVYILSLSLGYLVAVLLGLIIGLTAFWTMELGGVFTIYTFANQFFGGVLVPLWFFPPPLRRLADLLPFQAQTFIPLAIYTGQTSGRNIMADLALQSFWVVALGACAWLLWQRAIHRVVIQGG